MSSAEPAELAVRESDYVIVKETAPKGFQPKPLFSEGSQWKQKSRPSLAQ